MSKRYEAERRRALKRLAANPCEPEDLAAIAERHSARLRGERPEGCSKGCTGRMCHDALHCDANGR